MYDYSYTTLSLCRYINTVINKYVNIVTTRKTIAQRMPFTQITSSFKQAYTSNNNNNNDTDYNVQ